MSSLNRLNAAAHNLADLERILEQSAIDLALWGVGEAKGAAQLWAEIEKGESTLRLDPLQRVVEAVSILLPREERILIEVGQELHDGRFRERRQPPGEKMTAGERPLHAAWRCLYEELGLTPGQVRLFSPTPRITREIRSSRSFPGLPTLYTVYLFEGAADSLPDGRFSTAERAGGGSPVARHHWAWVPLAAVDATGERSELN